MKQQALLSTLSILSILLITFVVHNFLAPTGLILRDFEENTIAYGKYVQIADHCQRVTAPVEIGRHDLCDSMGMEQCCKAYNMPGCSRIDLPNRLSLCLHKCIEDVRNQCRKTGLSQHKSLQTFEEVTP